MKKILIVIAVMFVLSGCNQANNNIPVTETITDQVSVATYQNEELNISFNHPSDWTMEENDTNKSITIQSSQPPLYTGRTINITIPAESFDEYEERVKDLIASEKMSVNNSPIEGVPYPTKEYGQEGWLYYLIQINDNYISVGSEMYLTQEQEEGLKEIVNSLSF